jgi:hypothetical protein
MTESIKDIDDLFSIFHDFEIVGLRLKNQVLTMEVLLPWSEIWQIKDYKMTFRFDGCTNLKCTYSKRIGNKFKAWALKKRDIYLVTNNPTEIQQLKLEVQHHDFNEPDNFILYCNSSFEGIESGKIELNIFNYQIFDNEMNEMTLDKMEIWATEWWNGI